MVTKIGMSDVGDPYPLTMAMLTYKLYLIVISPMNQGQINLCWQSVQSSS